MLQGIQETRRNYLGCGAEEESRMMEVESTAPHRFFYIEPVLEVLGWLND